MWGPSRTTITHADGRESRYRWLALPVAAVVGATVVVVAVGLVLGNGLDSHSTRMIAALGVWTLRPGMLVTGLLVVYGQSIYGELRGRVRALVDDDAEADTPLLLRLELAAFGAVPLGIGLYALFFWSYEVPWRSSIAAQAGFYAPMGWFVGICLWFGAPVVLAVARFAEALAFTGDRGSDDDGQDVVGRFR